MFAEVYRTDAHHLQFIPFLCRDQHYLDLKITLYDQLLGLIPFSDVALVIA